MSVLVLAEHDQGKLSPATARLVAAAVCLSNDVDVLVAGENSVADAAASLQGVARVRLSEAASPETLTALLETLAPEYDAILAAAAAAGRDVIPRLAAKLDLMPVTDIVAIAAADTFTRPVYAGNALETVVSAQQKQLLTVRASAFRPVGQGGNAPIEPVAVPAVVRAAEIVAEHRTAGDVPDLATARVVVGGGIAVGSAEGFRLIEDFARRLGAAVGATRAAVDAGYAPNDWQVGQTGKVIAPDLYIAFGISGALQHLAGISGAKRIVAVNIDPEAPLMKLADLALVGDLFAVIPALEAELTRLGVIR
jgi:electron transfer flavoprotein alpha subunit